VTGIKKCLDDRDWIPGKGKDISLRHHFRPALVTTQPPIQWVHGAISPRVKPPGREADQSPPSTVEVKESVEPYVHSPNTPSWHGAQLKHRDNFIFTFTFDSNRALQLDM